MDSRRLKISLGAAIGAAAVLGVVALTQEPPQLPSSQQTVEESAPSVESTSASPRVHATSWKLDGVSASGRVVTINVTMDGGCTRFKRVVVTESTTSVILTALVAYSPPDNNAASHPAACALNTVVFKTHVTLKSPLGDRKLLGMAQG